MKEPISLRSDDPLIQRLSFKPYRNITQRRVKSFSPSENEPQTKEVVTPWGAKLTAKKGDMLISEVDKPEDAWPIDADIFDKTYLVISPGFCIKRAVTLLAPLTEVTGGDADQLVTIYSLEGIETVRAGDFFLAKGIKGEIWAYPKEKAEEAMRPAE